MQEISPTQVKGVMMDVRYVVQRKLPASGLLPERTAMCGHVMK